MGEGFQPRMLGLLLVQAVVALPLAFAVGLAAWCPAPLGGFSLVAGIAIALTAVAGEALADRQMHHFRSNTANKGKVCDAGLWHWSRHPNYFFRMAVLAGLSGFGPGRRSGLGAGWLLPRPALDVCTADPHFRHSDAGA